MIHKNLFKHIKSFKNKDIFVFLQRENGFSLSSSDTYDYWFKQ